MSVDRETLFFLHIPKNSGTTLNTIIRENYRSVFIVSWDKSSPNHAENILAEKPSSVFAGYEVVRGHFPYGLHEALPSETPFTYFTMLRDPVKRTWSQYNYLRSDSTYINKHPDLKSYLNDLSLDDYCRKDHLDVPNHTFTDNAQVRYMSGVADSKPFGSLDEADLAIAKQHLGSMHFGLTEEFNRSMLLLQHSLGWKRILFTRQKEGSHKAVSPTPDEIESLEACNQLDMQLYNFGQVLFAERASLITAEALQKYEDQLARYQKIERLKSTARRSVKRLLGHK